MSQISSKSLLVPAALRDTESRKKREQHYYWIIPAFVLILYLLVIVIFFRLQIIQQANQFFVTDIESSRQHLLIVFMSIMSIIIVICLLALWHFMREHNRTEEALFVETAFRRAMENSMSTGMRVLDMQGRIIYVNPAFCRLVGWNESDLLGRCMPFPYWFNENFEQHKHILETLLSGKIPSSGIEIEAHRRDGSRLIVHMYVSPLRDSNGTQIGWMTSMTDISEPKRIREALTVTHERFVTVLESLEDAISVVVDTPNGMELLFANRTYRHFFGSGAAGHKEILQAYNNRTDVNNHEFFIESTHTWFEVQHRVLNWNDGRRVRMQVARDITQKRQYEEELRSQQEKVQLNSRLTTMGEMASSLAHELNQPLTSIVNYNAAIMALLKTDKINQERLIEILAKSVQQATRAGKIISRIREFVKRNEPRRQVISISKIVNNTLDLAYIQSHSQGIKIVDHVPTDLPEIFADPILIEQVLLNLVKNGIESMKDSEHRFLYVNASQQGKQILVRVIDSGHGIKDYNRLFEPFFSTKTEGLGMGLNICRTIIESHQGQLWAENNPNGGTIFQFLLPCYEQTG